MTMQRLWANPLGIPGGSHEPSGTQGDNRYSTAPRFPTIGRETAAHASAGPIFSVSGLHVHYGGAHVLKGVTLDIPRTGIQAIIGPPGCGKSTFLRALNRMNDRIAGHRIAGHVLLNGQDVYGRGVDVVALRRRIGMVFQKPIPFPMSIYESVAYAPRLHRLVRSRADQDAAVEKSLRQTGLWNEVKERLGVPASHLSGGQQQRLAIARALALDPEAILLDEPTSAIDPRGTAWIEDTLQHLGGEYTIVLVTHSIQQAARVSQRTAFFLDGEVVEEGPTDRIFHRPVDPRTEEYVTGGFG